VRRRIPGCAFFFGELRRMKKQLTLFTLVLLACSALSACNTFHGFGEDVSHLGGAISRAAK